MIKFNRKFLGLIPVLALAGCAAPYSLVTPGAVAVDGVTVQVGSGWNNAPVHQRAYARKNSVAWTKDGLLLDRLVIIPGVPDGEPLLVAAQQSQAMPVFRADMLPNELEELVESTIVKFWCEVVPFLNLLDGCSGLKSYGCARHCEFSKILRPGRIPSVATVSNVVMIASLAGKTLNHGAAPARYPSRQESSL